MKKLIKYVLCVYIKLEFLKFIKKYDQVLKLLYNVFIFSGGESENKVFVVKQLRGKWEEIFIFL